MVHLDCILTRRTILDDLPSATAARLLQSAYQAGAEMKLREIAFNLACLGLLLDRVNQHGSTQDPAGRSE